MSGTSDVGLCCSKPSTSGAKRKLTSEQMSGEISDEQLSSPESDDDTWEYASTATEEEEEEEESEHDENEGHHETGPDNDEQRVNVAGESVFLWKRDAHATRRFPFKGTPGIPVTLKDASDPLEIFFRFVTDEMIDNIVRETNRQAKKLLLTEGLMPSARIRRWRDTTAAEIKVFIALIMYQGIVRKPKMHMYWTTDPMFATPYMSEVMSFNRFFLLECCLHFVDNGVPLSPSASDTDKALWKIRPFLEPLISNFRSVYTPTEFVAVDESLMLWKSRLGIKEYLPRNQARWGLKSYELCEGGSGYIWNSFVHTGSGDKMELDASRDGLTSSRIVLTLMRDLLNLGYRVYMDNFYSSPMLFAELFDKKTDAVGTVQTNRCEMPQCMRRPIPRGTTTALFAHNSIMVLKWHGKREVTMLSTVHDAQKVTVKHHKHSKTVPLVIHDYDKSMGAVDLADQMLTVYPIENKRKKVCYIFRHLLNQASLNSYILHKKYASKPLNRLQFICLLINRLIETNNSGDLQRKIGRPSLKATHLRLMERHFPSQIHDKSSSQNLRDCTVCCAQKSLSGKKCRKRSAYECVTCNVGLCVDPCFRLYHTKRDP